MKKIVILLALILALGLSACGSSRTTVQEEAAAPAAVTESAEPTMPSTVPTIPEDEQKRILEENRSLWAFTDPFESPWFYTFTDLDCNGRTEVIAATTQGTGIYTYAHFYEVRADGSGIDNCYHENMEIEGPDDWPEIVRDSLPCYYDAAADRYYYVCEGVTHDGYAHQYYAWYALCLKNGVAEWEPIAYKNDNWDANGNCTTDCHDAQGNDITQADYESAVKRRFAGLQELTLSLSWTQEEIEWGYSADSSWMDEPAESADSTVEDFSAAYSSVIEKYRAAYDSGNTENLEYIWNNGISEIIGYSSGVGYALEDLDQNGIPELIIAGMGTDDFSNRMVYDLYTLENNVPVNIVTSQARSRYYIRTDNTVLFEGSGGASYSYFTVKRLNGNMLEDMESVFTNLDQDAYDTYSTGFYYQQGYSETLPSDSSIKITEEDFGKRVWEMESSVYVPTLTQIF